MNTNLEKSIKNYKQIELYITSTLLTTNYAKNENKNCHNGLTSNCIILTSNS